jgi:hypothetical protein
MSTEQIEPLLSPLASLQKVLDHFDQQGIIIGGVAASLLGKPRLTADVDAMLLLSIDDLPHLIEVAAQEELHPRIDNAKEFARQNRVLLLRHAKSGIHVDISLGVLPFEVEAVERSSLHKAGSIEIRLPTPEDLIILKAVAHRPKDLQDIQAIIQVQSNLDKERIHQWVEAFAEALEMPELWDDISGWL